MSAGKLTELKKMVTGLVRRNNQFDRESARALVQSAGLGKAQSRAQRRATRPRKGPSQPSSGRSASGLGFVSAPVATNTVMRGFARGLPDMPVRFNYCAGQIVVVTTATSGTRVPAGTVAFQPSTITDTNISCNWVPVAPADISTLNPGNSDGYGAGFVNDVFKHFARVRYNRIGMWVLPYGRGTSTTNSTSYVIAPYRGALANIADNQSTNGPYRVILANTSSLNDDSPFTTGDLLTCKGAISGSTWQPAYLDLTPYIAGGSGPKQNEFTMQGYRAGLTGTPQFAVNVPVSYAVSGQSFDSSILALPGTTSLPVLAEVVIELDCNLLDFVAVTLRAPSAVGDGKDGKDYKEPAQPASRSDLRRPPMLDFRAAVGRRVDDAPSPTKSLLGAELDKTYVSVDSARTKPVAIPSKNATR